jgi:hypothetical protein
MGTESLSPGGIKRQGREADRTLASNAEVKNRGALPPLPHISSWHNIHNRPKCDLTELKFIKNFTSSK